MIVTRNVNFRTMTLPPQLGDVLSYPCLTDVRAITSDLAGYVRTVARLATDAAMLVGDPPALAARLIASVAELGGLSISGDAVLSAFETLSTFGFGFLPISETTPNRTRQAQNRAGLIDLTRRAAAIEAARSSMLIQVSSYDEAVSVRDRALTVVDREADAAGETNDIDAYRALRELGLAVVRDFRVRGATLARIAVIIPRQTIPVLLLAHQFYGNIDRVDEIVARNGIRHPGFVPGGQPVELLVAG